MIKEREKVVNNFIAVLDVFVGIGSFLFALVLFFKSSTFLNSRDFQIIIILIAIIWWIMSKSLSLSILHRSRPLSNILFKCLQLSVTGTVFLGLFIYFLNLEDISLPIIQYFLPVNLVLTFLFKAIVYFYMRKARRNGRNTRTIIIIGDESSVLFIRQLLDHVEWGYQIYGVIGSESLKALLPSSVRFLTEETNVDRKSVV